MKNIKTTIKTALMISGVAFTLFISCSDPHSANGSEIIADSTKLFSPLTDEDTLNMQRPVVDSLNNNL